MLKNTRKSLAPSSLADSSRESGIWLKKLRMTIRLKALTMPGRMYTQKLFKRPRDLFSRKLGIRPPENHMVNTIRAVRTLRGG